jgi:hypothetical protein
LHRASSEGFLGTSIGKVLAAIETLAGMQQQ